MALACLASLGWGDAVAFTLGPGDQTTLCYPRRATATLRGTAEDLARVIGAVSGATVVARPWPWLGEPTAGILLAPSAEAWAEEPQGPPGRFEVTWKATESLLVLDGGSVETAVAGAYRFVQEQLGARWYFPGPEGEFLPERRTVEVSPMERTFLPSFWARTLYFDQASPAERQWIVRNGLTTWVPHGENLFRIVGRVPEIPEEWGPLFGQERKRPDPNDPFGWQPNVDSASLVAHTAAVAREHFAEVHEAWCFSIAFNDSFYFGEYPEKPAPVPAFYGGWPNAADLVFSFSNRVAEEVSKTHPEKYLGCLSYGPYSAVPSFPIAANLVPFICEDRGQYYDLNFKVRDRQRLREWLDKGPRYLGYRDYLYGAGYFLPRFDAPTLASTIREAAGTGRVPFYFSELDPIWGFDGAKAWMVSQLLWDAGASEERLLDEYYARVYGRAAPTVAAFFRQTAAIWNRQRGPGTFLKLYRDPHQSFLITDEAWERALSGLAEVPEEDRTTAFNRLWEAVSYARSLVLLSRAVWAEDSSPRIAALILKDLDFQQEAIFRDGGGVSEANRRLFAPEWQRLNFNLPYFYFRNWGAPERAPDAENLPWWRAQGFEIGGPLPETGPNLMINGGFEGGAVGWTFVEVPAEGTSGELAAGPTDQGNLALRLRRARHWQVFQAVPVQGSQVYVIDLRVAGKLRPEDRVELRVDWYDAEKRRLALVPEVRLFPTESDGGRSLGVIAASPARAASARVLLYVDLPVNPGTLVIDDFQVRPLLNWRPVAAPGP